LLGGEERIAQAPEVLWRNPYPFVAHLDHDPALGGVEGGGHSDPASPVGQRLQGVGHEIHHDLFHMLRVSPYER
jgi:hypothetical protein